MTTGTFADDSHASQVQVPCIIFFVLTPIFLFIRFWSRISRKSGIGLDDQTILVSFACTLTVQILMMLACRHGFGQRMVTLSQEDRLVALKLFYVAQIFYKITINLTKVSILLFYLRIFVQTWFRVCCFVLITFIVAFMFATVGASIWQCDPIAGAWQKSLHPTCIDLTKNWFANAGYSIATDVLILCLPMQLIWTSQLPRTQKMALMFVFALGVFVTATSIMRMTTLSFSTQTSDPTYDIDSTLWTMIEENVAIICACLPTCRIILALIFPKAFQSPPAEGCGGPGSSRRIFTIGSMPRRILSSQSDDELQLFSGPTVREDYKLGVELGIPNIEEKELSEKPGMKSNALHTREAPSGSAWHDNRYDLTAKSERRGSRIF